MFIIEEIYTSFHNGNFEQMREQIDSYPHGKYECFDTLYSFINEYELDRDDFARIVLTYFKERI